MYKIKAKSRAKDTPKLFDYECEDCGEIKECYCKYRGEKVLLCKQCGEKRLHHVCVGGTGYRYEFADADGSFKYMINEEFE